MLFKPKERDIADALVHLSERGNRQVGIYFLLDNLVKKTLINGNDFYQFIQKLKTDEYIRLDYDNNFPKMITPQLMDSFKRRYPRITITSDSVCEDLLNLCDNHSIYVNQKLIDASDNKYLTKEEIGVTISDNLQAKLVSLIESISKGNVNNSDSLSTISQQLEDVLSELIGQTKVQKNIRQQVDSMLSEALNQSSIQEEISQQVDAVLSNALNQTTFLDEIRGTVGGILSEESTQNKLLESIDNNYKPKRTRIISLFSLAIAIASFGLSLARQCSPEIREDSQVSTQQEVVVDSLSNLSQVNQINEVFD